MVKLYSSIYCRYLEGRSQSIELYFSESIHYKSPCNAKTCFLLIFKFFDFECFFYISGRVTMITLRIRVHLLPNKTKKFTHRFSSFVICELSRMCWIEQVNKILQFVEKLLAENKHLKFHSYVLNVFKNICLFYSNILLNM